MRSAIIVALAAGAVAMPYAQDVVTDTVVDVAYATDIVTVTAGQGPPPTPAAAAPSSDDSSDDSSSVSHYGHHWGSWTGSWGGSWTGYPSGSQATGSPSEAPSTSTPQAAPTSEAPTSQAPTSPQAPPSSAPQSSAAPTSQPAASQTWSSGGSGATSAAPSGYNDITVYHHNLHRANHSSGNMEWNDTLASIASTIAQSCNYAHNTQAGGGGYGQNIAAGVQSDNISAIITDLFYNGEVNYYNGLYGQAQPSMTNFEQWGHFSQIVWNSSTSVGCATQDCTSQGLQNVGSDVSPYFTVCNYYPAGNFANEYGANIGEPVGDATAQWNTGMS